jgi:hypothetical protein
MAEQLSFFSPVSTVTGQTAWSKKESDKRLQALRAEHRANTSYWEGQHNQSTAERNLSNRQFNIEQRRVFGLGLDHEPS